MQTDLQYTIQTVFCYSDLVNNLGKLQRILTYFSLQHKMSTQPGILRKEEKKICTDS